MKRSLRQVPLSPLAKDPSDMSDAQLEVYAETVLSSGNASDMADAFEAVQDNLPADAADDPEMYLLAADLALGGSGLTEAITDVLPDVLDGGIDETFDYESILESFDDALIAESVAVFEDVAAVEGADISESQYVNAAVAQALVIINEAGGDLDAVDENDPRMDQVEAWAELGGVDISYYLGLTDDSEE